MELVKRLVLVPEHMADQQKQTSRATSNCTGQRNRPDMQDIIQLFNGKIFQ